MLVTDEINVTYLTGFTGDSSYLLVTPKQVVLLSDSRYTIQIQEECRDLEVDIRTAKTSMLERVAAVISKCKLQSLAIESDSMTKSFYDALAEELKAVNLVDTNSVVQNLRAIKDSYEIRTIRQSVRIAERAFEVIRAELRGEQSELEVAHNLEHTIRRFGGSRCAFEPIVGGGAARGIAARPAFAAADPRPSVRVDRLGGTI